MTCFFLALSSVINSDCEFVIKCLHLPQSLAKSVADLIQYTLPLSIYLRDCLPTSLVLVAYMICSGSAFNCIAHVVSSLSSISNQIQENK